ncbi:hypothetical protein ACEXQD_02935 [Herbiconiux sp. P15]|uniref:hypothetical protein n=1 Tax=Herbiconiux liukaitaii TaxID=3342799 RepID=UPI0035B86616
MTDEGASTGVRESETAVNHEGGSGGGVGARDARFVWVVLVVGVVVALGVAVALFFAGMAAGGSAAGAGVGGSGQSDRADESVPGASASGSPTAAPSEAPATTAPPTSDPAPEAAAAAPTGPVGPGVHDWNELSGGECLGGFTSPWSEQFTVVDCAGEHNAQLVTRGSFTDPTDPASAAVPFPGEAELAGRLNLLCTAPAVLDYAAAGALPDVQWQAAYPVTEAEWVAGERSYYCFFSRTSGEPLGASLVAPAG